MTNKNKKGSMRRKHPAYPGMEHDAHGDPIPMEKRLPEDQAKAHRAAINKRRSKKKAANPTT